MPSEFASTDAYYDTIKQVSQMEARSIVVDRLLSMPPHLPSTPAIQVMGDGNTENRGHKGVQAQVRVRPQSVLDVLPGMKNRLPARAAGGKATGLARVTEVTAAPSGLDAVPSLAERTMAGVVPGGGRQGDSRWCSLYLCVNKYAPPVNGKWIPGSCPQAGGRDQHFGEVLH